MAYARYESVAVNTAGDVIPNATVEVREDRAGRPVVPLWANREGTEPLGNPIKSDELGKFGFYVKGGSYYIRVFVGPSQQPFQQYVRRHQAVGTAAERDVEDLAASLEAGTATFPTLAGLEAFVPPEGVGGKVTTGADAGFYHYDSGATAWVFDRPLYDSLARMTVTGGTADAITATIDNHVDASAVVMMLLTPEATNTGAVTINGTDLVAFDGAPLEAGWLVADVPVFLFVNGDGDYQLTTDVRYQALAAQTLAARNATFTARDEAATSAGTASSAAGTATGAAGAATTAAGTATGAAQDAIGAKEAAEALYGDLGAVAQAKNDAVAASEAAGVDHWEDTKADATLGLGGYAEGDVIGVFADETKGGAQVFYRVDGGTLAEKIDANERMRQVIEDQFDTDFLNTAAIEATAGVLGTRAFDVELGVFREFDGVTLGGHIGGRFSKEVPLWNTSVRLGVETDNAPKINEIAGNLAASGGGVIKLPADITSAVFLGDTVVLDDGVGIEGVPRNSVLRMIAGCDKTAIQSASYADYEAWNAGGRVGAEPTSTRDISLRHIYVDGNYGLNAAGGGIWLHAEGVVADDLGLFGTAEEGWKVVGANVISSLVPKSAGREEGMVTRLVTRRCGHLTGKDSISHVERNDWRYDNTFASLAGRHGFYANASIEIGFLHAYSCHDVCVYFDTLSNIRALHIAARDGLLGNFKAVGGGVNNWIGLLYAHNGGRSDPTKPSIVIDTGDFIIDTVICATPNGEPGVVIEATTGKNGHVQIGKIKLDGRSHAAARTMLHVNRAFTTIEDATIIASGANATALKTQNAAGTKVRALITGTTSVAWDKVDTNGNANEWDITIASTGITTPKTGGVIGPNETVNFKHQTGTTPWGSRFKGVTTDVAVDAVASVDVSVAWNLIQAPTSADISFSPALRASGVQVTDAVYAVILKSLSATGATFTVKTTTASATAGAKIAIAYRVGIGR